MSFLFSSFFGVGERGDRLIGFARIESWRIRENGG